jgi:hypothetical protein
MYLTPESAQYLHDHALTKVQNAMSFYTNTVAPYWFVSKYEATAGEGVIGTLYDSWSLFLARTWILKQPRGELLKYLDVPSFARGDLFYIQNLILAIEAQP